MTQTHKQFVVDWNNRFPLDRAYRKKYNIPFGSEQHRSLSQVNIYFEWIEDELYSELVANVKLEVEAEEQLSKGIWIKESEVNQEDEDRLFNQLKI